MAQGMRPGGLTALAVVNFVFCGIGILGAFGTVISVKMGPSLLAEMEKQAEERAAKGEKEKPGEAANRAQIRHLIENEEKVYVQGGLTVIEAVLLLLSGLGYIGLKRVMGRFVGSAAAIVGLGSVAFQLTWLPFELAHMISLIYPILTLILLNTTFRDDLVN